MRKGISNGCPSFGQLDLGEFYIFIWHAHYLSIRQKKNLPSNNTSTGNKRATTVVPCCVTPIKPHLQLTTCSLLMRTCTSQVFLHVWRTLRFLVLHNYYNHLVAEHEIKLISACLHVPQPLYWVLVPSGCVSDYTFVSPLSQATSSQLRLSGFREWRTRRLSRRWLGPAGKKHPLGRRKASTLQLLLLLALLLLALECIPPL